jgi:hypothetical protein
MKTEIISQDWFKGLIEECDALLVETHCNSHWILLEGYHKLGVLIIQEKENFENNGYGQKIVQLVANSLHKSERTIYNAIQLAEQYPDMNTLPEGKAITWSKMCKKYLLANTESCCHPEYKKVTTEYCVKCGKRKDENV